MYDTYVDLNNPIMYSIIILLSPLVFGSAAYLNHSYALRDTQTTTTTAKYNSTSYSHYNNGTSCNCVVFRMDDLQDYWIRTAQITGMNLFLSKQIPLSLAIIMNSIGNDSLVVDKISEGSKMPNALFELAIHGWDHVNYAAVRSSGIKVVYVPHHQTEKGNYADWKFRAPTHQGALKPTVSKMISRSDDVQIKSVRETTRLGSDFKAED